MTGFWYGNRVAFAGLRKWQREHVSNEIDLE